LRGKVTSNNIKEINRFILDSIEYWGIRWEFIRTFSPAGQKKWESIFWFYDSAKKSIWL
jgi:hypothetical protein